MDATTGPHAIGPHTIGATFCATLVDEWVELGLEHAVICPGSRSTPMALALHEHPSVQTAVVLDERTAAFAALGASLASGRPTAVLTTSGTATVNLHPAVAEADAAGVGLLALTADRPPELHGVGAPQTIDQADLFGAHARAVVHPGVPDDTDPATWRTTARAAWDAAVGSRHVAPGPVQVNLAFRDPLTGSAGSIPPRSATPAPVDFGPGMGGLGRLLSVADDGRVLVVADHPVDRPARLAEVCERQGWALIGGSRIGIATDGVVRRHDAILRVPELAASLSPDLVIRIGQLPTSKVLGQWLDGLDDVHQVGLDPWGRVFDPGRSADQTLVGSVASFVAHVEAGAGRGADPSYRAEWLRYEAAADEAIATYLGAAPLTEPGVARIVTTCAASRTWPLVVGSSMPIRDVEWFGRRPRRVIANRGANGIDGTIGTATGVAAATGAPTVALMGDLTFLHDSNGLIGWAGRPIDLSIVVVDNGGGGIFSFLPQHELLDPGSFETLFATPHGVDLVALAAATGVEATSIDDAEGLRGFLDRAGRGGGVRVGVVSSDRAENQRVHEALHAAVATAVRAVDP